MGESRPQNRRLLVIVLSILVPVLFLIGWSQASLNLHFIRPKDTTATFLLAAVSAIVFIAFVIFALILLRILLKLYTERRQNQLGSRFKTKMIVAFLCLSLLPVCFLFLFAYGLINRSIDKWFGIPFNTVRRDAIAITAQLALASRQSALESAERLAAAGQVQQRLADRNGKSLARLLTREADDMKLQSVFCFGPTGHLVAQAGAPVVPAAAVLRLFPAVASGTVPAEGTTASLRSARTELFLAAQPVKDGEGQFLGTLVTTRELPLNIGHIADEIQQQAQRYDRMSREKKSLARLYLLILLLLTLLILFAATWFAMFFSKQVTVPVQALAEATHEVSKGNLGWRITARADAELGSLIQLFNEMTSQLQGSRRAIETAAAELQSANRQLEEHGNTMEAILQNVPTGVISFNPQQEITRLNSTAERMVGRAGAQPARHLADLFSPDEAREVSRLFSRAHRQGVVNRQMTLSLNGRRALVGLTLSSVSAQHGAVGYVMVLEDLTEFVRAQRSAAWREVAQRVAHEIKNPLTPIALSADRIRRLIDKADSLSPHLLSAVAESASLIEREVATLKGLVDEFSTYARFPASKPVPANVNQIVESALGVFNGRLGGVTIHRDLALDLPMVHADPEQIKRAVVNLVDNAAEALDNSPLKQIWLQTCLAPDGEGVTLVVADSGPGIRPEDKERLFLPYFSTKNRGTGLGLTIVSRIVSEHNGRIRAEKNWPSGTRFVIELPAASSAAVDLV